jgi:septin family protein
MKNFEEIRNYFYKEKNLYKENLQDTRIHLCLFFMENTTISMLEMLYM